MTIYTRHGKRLLDVACSFIGLVALSPLLGLLAILVLWQLGKPVLFRQQRPGLSGRLFECIKFRTMTEAQGSSGELLPDVKRLTPFGRILRRTSLDELPELVNVLRGEMSLVGPRPLLAEYLPLYSPEQARRHEVRPGITGWAQVNGRNDLGWGEKFKLDVWYVDHQGFCLDIKILMMTLGKVIKGEGVCAEGDATMAKFKGGGA